MTLPHALALNIGSGSKLCIARLSNMNVIPQKTPLSKDTSTTYLVVESAHMQGGVSRCILGAHVSSVKQQVFQVLHVAIAAGLKGQIPTFNLYTNQILIHLHSQKGAIAQSL